MSVFFLTCLTTIMALENVALNKPAQQVSDKDSASADKAVDGNTDGIFFHGYCTHTLSVGSTTWWKVDLMNFFEVISVEIFTRTDCCIERLQNFEVRVSLTNPVRFPSSEGQQCFNRTDQVPASGVKVNCTQPIIGRYVSLFKATLDVLSICELRVFADKAEPKFDEAECGKNTVQLTSPAVNLSETCIYSAVMDNTRLISPTLKSFDGVSAIKCAVECAKTDNCFGFNFMTSAAASNNRTCELLRGRLVFVPFGDPVVTLQDGWRVFYTCLPIV